MIKAAGSCKVPAKLYVVFASNFLLSLAVALWFPNPLVLGFSAVTCSYLLLLIFRPKWFISNKQIQYGTVHDSMESWLKENQPMFESLFEHNPNIVFLMDCQGVIIKANGNTEQLIGYLKEDMINISFHSLLSEESARHSLHAVQHACQGTPQTFKTAVQHKDGYRVDLDATAAPIKQGMDITGIIVIGQDITANKRTEERIRHMAYYDDMTGLPNRSLFINQLNESITKAVQHPIFLAVFLIDIDRFKVVNDCFGHDYGDMLLLQLAERFSRCITQDDFLARTQGDEFALFFARRSGTASVTELAEQVIAVLEEPFTLEAYQLHITASIGISQLSDEELDAETIIKYADIALTHAKNKGKQTYQIFNTEMKSDSLQRLTLENDLRRALSHNELLLHYQPQMDIQTGNIVGFEALIRWLHPVRGLVPPNEFIPYAEESGLIVPIGEWVMQEACRQNKLWQDEGFLFVPVSVNLSTRQFLQHNLRDQVSAVLQRTGLAASYLELEITESSTMDVDFAIGVLLELKALGVKISIDDFGTGYSSLSYLKRFPIDKLKIDQSFVRDIMTDPNDAAIVASIIAMTRHMNLRVIAEGVETEDQLGFLRNNHCNEIQGYWFSPPVSTVKAEELMLHFQQVAAHQDEETGE
ncbi:PAS domain S-box-containing protein/diguanylate cyclase (GGDEF) domain-containing protein [Paenibacillus sp. 1_12]|uniref:EAL domain-containing protein n=1 Tax=Paenibacillus sp. 1_12 TaxID=1566278 RepID=UPI0008DF9639|nr:EAL domain-containing protein [Paenibacillus sp. 1_12]SFL16726.1 PAS domain S-box-containing protein/diguanylate cyclase (GGDEF) domain-containing protein [Paenibacillus sp. 1_12]